MEQLDRESVNRTIGSWVHCLMPTVSVGERSVTVSTPQLDGATTVETVDLPHTAYKNIWKATEDYQRGDMVTFGGSVWHCDQDCQDKKPGLKSSADYWTLCVKKGRDGK